MSPSSSSPLYHKADSDLMCHANHNSQGAFPL
jgi:hypothetical protein